MFRKMKPPNPIEQLKANHSMQNSIKESKFLTQKDKFRVTQQKVKKAREDSDERLQQFRSLT